MANVKRLEQVQAELDRRNARARQDLGSSTGNEAPTDGPAAQGSPGRRGGTRGAGAPGRARSRRKRDGDRAAAEEALERTLDQNDTQAFLQAEALLREDQRPRARDIAEKYREDLYEERERLRHPAAEQRPAEAR